MNTSLKKSQKAVLFLLATFSVFIYRPSTAIGQTDSRSEVDPELQELQSEIDKLKLELQLLQTQRELAEAQQPILPESNVIPLEGRATVEGTSSIESHILTYDVMRGVAEQFRIDFDTLREINDDRELLPQSIIIHDENVINSLSIHRVYEAQRIALTEAFKEELPNLTPTEEVPSARTVTDLSLAAVPGSLLRSVIDLLALFRQDVTIRNETVNASLNALISQIAYEFRNNSPHGSITIYHPSLYLIDLQEGGGNELFSNILEGLDELFRYREQSGVEVSELEQKGKENRTTEDNRKLGRLKELNQQLDNFINGLSTINEATGVSAIYALARAEQVQGILKDGGAILFLDVEHSGGSSRTTRSLFSSGRVEYSGGVIVSYILFGRSGQILLSNTLHGYSGHQNVEATISDD